MFVPAHGAADLQRCRPGWSASGSGGAIENLGGITGAFFADVFFSLVGSAAYLVPVLLAYRAVSLLLAEG